MIDGAQFTYQTANPKSFLLGFTCWEVLVNEKSGQKVNDVRSANLRGLDLKLKPSKSGGYNLLVNGSLHKFHNIGEHNADQFTFLKLVQAIDSFTDLFCIDANKCAIHGLEIGVNIPLPYSPLKLLKNLVCYRSKAFTQINKRNVSMGLQCTLSQYSVKMYDKAKQSGLDCGHVLRFEIAVSRMQAVREYSITTLADLQDPAKVYPLVSLLKEAINGIIWTDSSVNFDRLSPREQKQWLFYSNPKTWESLGKYQRQRALKSWNRLLRKYGQTPELLPLVSATWESLFLGLGEAENPQPFYHQIQRSEALATATFLPLECTVNWLRHRVANPVVEKATLYRREKDNINKETKRYCLTCGRDISHQRKGSHFCSEGLYGKPAKQCRNKSSNQRRSKKMKIEMAGKENNFLAITYSNENGEAYTDILHPSELAVSRQWLDRIKNIVVLTIKAKQETNI